MLNVSGAQGGLPDTAATKAFAQSLLDKLPRSSGQNGVPSYAQQERKKATLASRNRAYALLEASDEEETAAEAIAVPTTRAVPAKAKQLRKSKVSRESKLNAIDNPSAKLTSSRPIAPWQFST